MTTVGALADELGVAVGDVLEVLDGFAPPDAIPYEIAVEVRVLLDPDGSRREAGRR